MFVEMTVIVEGALEGMEMFTDYALLNERLRDLAKEAEADGQRTEVYLLRHEHDPDVEECACAQYVTDHHPDCVFPGEIPALIT